MNCAPSLDSLRNSRSPLLSMNVTSLRSTIQARRASARWFFFQHVLSSCTHGWISWPCRIHLSSAGVSLNVIFNMLFSSGRVGKKRVCDSKHDCVDVYVISFSSPHRYSCCISPEARVPPAANRPAHNRELRHVRGESQTLAGGFLPRLDLFFFLLRRPPTEK